MKFFRTTDIRIISLCQELFNVELPSVQLERRCKQEAQLSQRDRATLRVIEYFASHSRSLKVIRNDTAE